MSVWDIYESRILTSGEDRRAVALKREQRMISKKMPNNLSYQTVLVDGVQQDVAVINTDNLNEKRVCTMPGGTISNGALIEWSDNRWLVTEKDAADEVYTRVKMVQCNYLLKWIDRDAVIHEQWCVIEDGTKYLVGTYEDREFVTTRGDSRLALTISKNEHTTKMKRGDRFLIDDAGSETMLAYELTKPFKLGSVYNEEGVFCFVLMEVNTTDEDNQQIGVADYYKYYPREDTGVVEPDNTINPNNTTSSGKKVWL